MYLGAVVSHNDGSEQPLLSPRAVVAALQQNIEAGLLQQLGHGIMMSTLYWQLVVCTRTAMGDDAVSGIYVAKTCRVHKSI